MKPKNFDIRISVSKAKELILAHIILFFRYWVLAIILIAANDKILIAQELPVEVFYTDGELWYPAGPPLAGVHSFTSNKENELLIYDSRGDKPFTRINIETKDILQFGSWGRGPGEITPKTAVTLRYTDQRIYAYDMIMRWIHIYDSEGTYLKSYESNPDFAMGFIHLYDEDNIFFRSEFSINPDDREYWLHTVSLNSGMWEIEQSGILSLTYDESFGYIKNNATLSFGPITFHSGKVYIGSLYSTMLAGYEIDGSKLFTTFSPERHPIPQTEMGYRGSNLTSEPDLSTFHAIDITADDEYIYMLYSGSEFSYEQVSGVLTSGGGEFDEEVRPGEARELRIFSVVDGAFKAGFRLPLWANSIEEVGDYLYLISWDDPIGIYRINKSEFNL